MTRSRSHLQAFTLVELLVVIVVIAVLLSIVLGVGTGVFGDAKSRETQVILQTLEMAIDRFNDDAPLAKVADYGTRYAANFPPDELDVFSAANGIPGFGNNVLPAGAALQDDQGSLIALTGPPPKVEHADMKAMVLAIQLFHSESASILDRLDARYRRTDRPLNKPDAALEVLNRPSPSGTGSGIDLPLTYYVDAWGTPIEYYCTIDAVNTGVQDTGDLRRDVSNALVAANKGRPLFVSYGPDGKDQLSGDIQLAGGGIPDLVGDYNDNGVDMKIDHDLNRDNIYSSGDPAFAEKLTLAP